MPISNEHVENWFSYHSPTPQQAVMYVNIRDATKVLAYIILNNAPDSADRTAAIRKLREVIMVANASIACGGK